MNETKEFVMRLTWVDYIALIALLRGFYIGYRGGIFPEILRLASYVVTILVTFAYYEPVAQLVTLKSFFNAATATAVSVAALLAIGFLVTKLLSMVLLKMLKVGEGGVLMRLLGMVLGGARWMILLSFLFMVVDRSPLTQLKKDIHNRSVVGEQISKAGPMIFDFMSNLSPQLGLPEKS